MSESFLCVLTTKRGRDGSSIRDEHNLEEDLNRRKMQFSNATQLKSKSNDIDHFPFELQDRAEQEDSNVDDNCRNRMRIFRDSFRSLFSL